MVLEGPADLRTMTAAMRPGVERSREGGQPEAPVCLIITPTIEQAMSAADQARRLLADPAVRVVPVTGAVRARRVLALAPVAVVTGTPADLLTLRRDAALSVEQLQTVVIVGLDEILAANGADTLQALLGDAPDNVSRVATLEQETEASDAFLEAVEAALADGPGPVPARAEAMRPETWDARWKTVRGLFRSKTVG